MASILPPRGRRRSAISSSRWVARSSQEERGMMGRLKGIMAAVTVLAALSVLWWAWTPAGAQQPAPAAVAATRVGYVDLQRILARSQAGVQAREQIEKEKAAMQKQVDSQKVDYDKLRDELEKKGQLLSADARREKQEALEGIFTRVGKEKGYAVIVERRQAGVVYGAPEVDVTEDVIKAFDDEMRKAKK